MVKFFVFLLIVRAFEEAFSIQKLIITLKFLKSFNDFSHPNFNEKLFNHILMLHYSFEI